MSTARRYASCRHAAIQCLTDRPSLIPAPPYGSERDLWVCAPQLDADNFPDICERFKIESVPAFLFFHKCMLTDSVTGANVSELVLKTKQNALTSAIHTNMVQVAAAVQPTPDQEPLEERLQALTKREPVMLFMKGNPEEPRCGFSRKIVELLQTAKVKFDTFDILSDEDVRQGLKKFSNFPTFPQLYADGKLVGGLDIVKEMHEDGELLEALPASAVG